MIRLPENDIEDIAQELLYKSLKDGRETRLRIEGYSMQPMLKSTDEVFFKKTKDLSFGDLAVYRKNGVFIVHRFMRKIRIANKVLFILKGDNSLKLDEPVEESQILGLVTRLKRNAEILELNSLRGKIESFYFFLTAYFNLAFIYPVFNKKYSFKQERKLLRVFLRDGLPENEKKELIQLLKDNLCWEFLTEELKCNFIVPLLVKKAKNFNFVEYIPKNSWQKLENILKVQIVNDTKNKYILNAVLSELNNEEIKVIFLKGAHLGMEVYEDSSFRWMGDVDLFVSEQDWARVYKILTELGFQTADLSKGHNIWALRHLDNHIDFYKEGLKLELKSNFWPIDFPYFNYSLWPGARKTEMANSQIFFPSYKDSLLIACVNLVRHNFQGFIWFIDIKKIIDKFGSFLDWEVFLETAKKYDLGAVAYYALNLTNNLVGLSLPKNLLARLKPNMFRRALFNLFWDKEVILLKKRGYTFRAKVPFECALVLFCGKFNFKPQRAMQYIFSWLEIIFPPRAYIQQKYGIADNPFLLFGYYLFRFFNFLSTMIILLFRLALNIKK